MNAIEALFDVDPNGKLAIPILIEALSSENGDIMSASALTLAKFGEKASPAVDALEKSLNTTKERGDVYYDVVSSSPVQRDVVRALGAIGPAARPTLPKLMQIEATDDNLLSRNWAAACNCPNCAGRTVC
jgi:HEAT repeat protein